MSGIAPRPAGVEAVALECTGQQPPEDLVSAVAEEALGVDAVVVAVEPQLDLVGGILRGTGRLEGDLCGGAPQVHGPQGPAPWPEPPAHPAVLDEVLQQVVGGHPAKHPLLLAREDAGTTAVEGVLGQRPRHGREDVG